jgi:hypothetical protein
MKLSDVVGHAGLAVYTEVALVLFLLVFAGVVVRTWWPSRRRELEAQRLLPLEPDVPVPPPEETTVPPAAEAPATSGKGAAR